MSSHKLDPYQEKLIGQSSQILAVEQSVLIQSETGSGKTVIFASIIDRYVSKSNKAVVIFVHKTELMNQTRKTLFNWYGIVSEKIDADTKKVNTSAKVFIAMVETFNNRSKFEMFLNNFKDVGLIIIDECHLSHFKKIFVHFYNVKRIGFTATPIAATKKDPLLNYYSGIIVGPTIRELIAINDINPLRGVVRCVEYAIKNINRANLKVKGDEFDEQKMGEAFSKKKQIKNTLNAYIKHGFGRKTICFNASVEHSLLMHQAFLDAGLNSRHLNGPHPDAKYKKYGTKEYREDCFKWLAETPNAILNNVGIATTGFDDPSIETVICNSSMMSMTLFRQKRGRGGRPYRYPDGTYKEYFLLLDMGDNIEGGGFGEWHSDVDWENLFNNPKIPKPGIAPCKSCPECGALNSASARMCQGLKIDWLTDTEEPCGYLFPIAAQEVDTVFKEMVRIGTLDINVKQNIDFFKDKHEYVSMYETYRQIAHLYDKKVEDRYLCAEQLDGIFEATHQKIAEWFRLKGKRKFPNFKLGVIVAICKELEAVGFCITEEEMALTSTRIGDTLSKAIEDITT